MLKRKILILTSIACLTGWFLAAEAVPQQEIGIPKGIVWYGVLEDGLAEAKATGKPIFLLSAAPNCAGVSGIW